MFISEKNWSFYPALKNFLTIQAQLAKPVINAATNNVMGFKPRLTASVLYLLGS